MTRNVFGWSLPPGCTTLPGEEPDAYELQMAHRCSKCGAFLRAKADRGKPWEHYTDCDGTISSYESEYDAASVQILGEEYRGKKYTVYMVPCGEEVSGPDARHKPHREIHAAGTLLSYDCRRCGHTTEWDN